MNNKRIKKQKGSRIQQENQHLNTSVPECKFINQSFDHSKNRNKEVEQSKKGHHRRVRTHTNDDFNVLLGLNRISENMATLQNEDNQSQQQSFLKNQKLRQSQPRIYSHGDQIQALQDPQIITNKDDSMYKSEVFSRQHLNNIRSIASTAASSQICQLIGNDENKNIITQENQIAIGQNTLFTAKHSRENSDSQIHPNPNLSYQFALMSAKEHKREFQAQSEYEDSQQSEKQIISTIYQLLEEAKIRQQQTQDDCFVKPFSTFKNSSEAAYQSHKSFSKQRDMSINLNHNGESCGINNNNQSMNQLNNDQKSQESTITTVKIRNRIKAKLRILGWPISTCGTLNQFRMTHQNEIQIRQSRNHDTGAPILYSKSHQIGIIINRPENQIAQQQNELAQDKTISRQTIVAKYKGKNQQFRDKLRRQPANQEMAIQFVRTQPIQAEDLRTQKIIQISTRILQKQCLRNIRFVNEALLKNLQTKQRLTNRRLLKYQCF
ncbi:UNKNOWN [Stylonychia lemnae]|uniref:Uncharacterized protein n=1 Tax=Stylonychia lemnae TaxID=5949 RepID=A0A078A9R6_STYLE|nr:UNKNOWN [Stylonychia lemnae]|eukprot:CDW78631.1 UNKNOWN [Stylonychia lemnae]